MRMGRIFSEARTTRPGLRMGKKIGGMGGTQDLFCETCMRSKPKNKYPAVKGWKCDDCRKELK